MKLVIGVTGSALDEDVTHYLAAGADMVLGKPVKVDMLRMLIGHVKVHGNISMPFMMLAVGPVAPRSTTARQSRRRSALSSALAASSSAWGQPAASADAKALPSASASPAAATKAKRCAKGCWIPRRVWGGRMYSRRLS